MQCNVFTQYVTDLVDLINITLLNCCLCHVVLCLRQKLLCQRYTSFVYVNPVARSVKGDVHTLQAGKDILAINNHLKKYPAAIDNFVDLWMVVKVGDPKYVYQWRLEAEHKAKAAGKSGMTDEQVADFVDRYMPGYVHYLPELYSCGPTTKQPGKVLTIEIQKSRQLTKEQPDQFMEN